MWEPETKWPSHWLVKRLLIRANYLRDPSWGPILQVMHVFLVDTLFSGGRSILKLEQLFWLIPRVFFTLLPVV